MKKWVKVAIGITIILVFLVLSIFIYTSTKKEEIYNISSLNERNIVCEVTDKTMQNHKIKLTKEQGTRIKNFLNDNKKISNILAGEVFEITVAINESFGINIPKNENINPRFAIRGIIYEINDNKGFRTLIDEIYPSKSYVRDYGE